MERLNRLRKRKTKNEKFIAVIAALTAFTALVSAYYPENRENIFVHGKTQENKIALTFDDGPNAKTTPLILDILEKYGIKATFFIIGENAEYNGGLLKREVAAGHEIGNHTYSHTSLKNMTTEDLTGEIIRAENAIEKAAGIKTELFRPPEGICDTDIAKAAFDLGYNVIIWKVDTRDWAGTPYLKIAEGVRENLRPGDIVLMHDSASTTENTPRALEILIPELLAKGWEFVTVSELIGEE